MDPIAEFPTREEAIRMAPYLTPIATFDSQEDAVDFIESPI